MNYSVGIIAALASTAKAIHCSDSPLRFNLNGEKKKCDWEGVACFGAFDSDKFASHCKGTCDVAYCCVDSLMKFNTPSDGYKDCKWAGKKEERCLDLDIADTCPVACKRCTLPTLQNLESDIDTLNVKNNDLDGEIDTLNVKNNDLDGEIDTLIVKNNDLTVDIDALKVKNYDLTAEIEILKASQASFCDLPDHVYIDKAGCFPFVYRDNELKLYVASSLVAPWETHNEAAIACGGNLASVLDEVEAGKIAVFNDWAFVGGMQTQPCDYEPAGCWVWSDGNEIGYTGYNWGDDQPDDASNGEHCLQIYAPNDVWNDIPCNGYTGTAIYMLPTNFNSNPNCNML